MTASRSDIQQALDFTVKFAALQRVAEHLLSIDDLDRDTQLAEARLAGAKAREEQFAADAQVAREAQIKRHEADMQGVIDKAEARLAALDIEAQNKQRAYQAQTDRDVSDREAKLGKLSHQVEVANAMLLGVESETAEARQALAALKDETDAVEARLKAAKDAVAALLA